MGNKKVYKYNFKCICTFELPLNKLFFKDKGCLIL